MILFYLVTVSVAQIVTCQEDIFYSWHVSDFHLDTRYGSEAPVYKDIFLGDYDEVRSYL